MRNWKITGFIATLVITLSFPVYIIKRNIENTHDVEVIQVRYVGKESCFECHKEEYELWTGSHHDMAMDTALEGAVLGNFDNHEFKHKGKTHKMYKKAGRFFVFTEGENGRFEEFQVAYTFGYSPLQQYLIPFEGGRLQCLPIAWDCENKKWFHMADTLYPDNDLKPDSWLYWTNQAQNWNGMCADCHSTNLKKNYDPNSKTFHTTWSEIDVSCEACHGPASDHLNWANLPDGARPEGGHAGFLFESKNLDNWELLGICARCHSRRSVLGDYPNENEDLLNCFVPQKLVQPYYYADGQVFDEDYVFGSFAQSKMFEKGVKCNDCHDVHSGELILDGNKLCLQCHRPDVYNTSEHHFHKMQGNNLERVEDYSGVPLYDEGEGAKCINCHMVGRYYMGIDYRRDHSFRVPRPDLTIEIGSPNACTDCHKDKTAEWAKQYIEKWYGIKKRPHYGQTFFAAQQGLSGVTEQLYLYATNELFPVMIRATSLVLLGNYNDSLSQAAVRQSLSDSKSLVRHSALTSFNPENLEDFIRTLSPMLSDPVLAIRTEAAFRLSEVPADSLTENQKKALTFALAEYKETNIYMSDFPGGQYNLGNYYLNVGEYGLAEEAFLEAIHIDDLFYRAKINLAMLYNNQGKNKESERLFREVLNDFPELYDINYSLGLLLAEEGSYKESKKYLLKAYEQVPQNSRILYNLALLENKRKNYNEAEKYFLLAIEKEPSNYDYLYGICTFYLSINDLNNASDFAERIKKHFPQNATGDQLKNIIQQKIKY
jgi:predicted CXXCH cytochrome family protein